MPSGRLIQRFLAGIARLDTVGIKAASGYDATFREAKRTSATAQVGVSNRKEFPVVKVPVQFSGSGQFEQLNAMESGAVLKSDIRLLMHFSDLRTLGLVDDDGSARIRPGDRLDAIYTIHGVLVQRFPDPPGLFVTEAMPKGFGINMASPTRNLLRVMFQTRDKAVVS